MSESAGYKFPESLWYGTSGWWGLHILLLPLALVFAVLVLLRKWAYRLRLFKQNRFGLPVIVVGNITVGGTGKTPTVIALVDRLRKAGWNPGVVSRGYGGESNQYPLLVTDDVPILESGDEPFLIARRTGCPVMVDPNRSRAVRTLENYYDVDIVISDDGLQHYAMTRDIEVAVIDGVRRLGNGLLLPAGPLREGKGRLKEVDTVLVNEGGDGEASFQLEQGEAVNMVDGSTLPLRAFTGGQGHVLAGIGNPEKFFNQVAEAGIKFDKHVYPDHYQFSEKDISFDHAKWVLMTEKDAVKCQAFANEKHWYVPVEARFNSLAEAKLVTLLRQLEDLRNTNG